MPQSCSHLLIHSTNIFQVPTTLSGTWDTLVNKEDKDFSLCGARILAQGTQITSKNSNK